MSLLSSIFKSAKKGASELSGTAVKVAGRAKAGVADILPRTTKAAAGSGVATKTPSTVTEAPIIAPSTGPNYKVAPLTVRIVKNAVVLGAGALGATALFGKAADAAGSGIAKFSNRNTEYEQDVLDRNLDRQQKAFDLAQKQMELWNAAGSGYSLPPGTNHYSLTRDASQQTVDDARAAGKLSGAGMALAAAAVLGVGYALLKKKKRS